MSQPTEPPSAPLLAALPRRPALSAAFFLILGIIAHEWLTLPPHWLLAFLLVLLPLALLLRKRPWPSCTALAMATFLVGLLAVRIESAHFPADHVAQFTTAERRLARLELHITDPPRDVRKMAPIPRRYGQGTAPVHHLTRATVLRILTRDGWRDSSGTILLHLDNPHPRPEERLQVGQRIAAVGLLQQPDLAMNPGEFDWADHYRAERVLASLHVAHAENISVLEQGRPSPLDRLRRGARELLGRGFTPAQSLDHALLRALVLGDKDPELRDVQEDFVRTGTSHHLAISGAHVMILGMIIFGICRVLFLSPRLSVWIGLGCVVLYGVVALPSPPVIRSVLLCVVLGLGLLAARSIDGVQLLALSVFAMLVYHPLDLYNAGFQLSFGTVLGLMTLTNPAMAFLESLEDRDVKIARSFRPPTGVAAAWLYVRRRLLQMLIAGVVAWAVSAPLIAVLFRQLNPWAIPGSLLLAPVVVLALVAGLLKILLTLAVPFFSGFFAWVAAAPIAWMRRIVDWLAAIPGSELPVLMPLTLAVALYALLFLPLFVRLKPGGLKWCVRCAPTAAIAVVFVLPLLAGWAGRAGAEGELRVTMLAVGAGQCAVVHLPSGEIVLIDAGSSTISDVTGRVVSRYLRHVGRRQVDSLFISHANYDHYSGAPAILSAGGVKELFVTPHFIDDSRETAAARAVLETAGSAGIPVRQLVAGRTVALDAETTLHVLWPSLDSSLEPNDSSLVLRLECRGRSILFTGDIEEAAQRRLLSFPDPLRADVLIAPHHGSTEATTAAFLEAARPRYVLSSNDHTLSQKQRALEGLCGSIPLMRTHRRGALTVIVDRAGGLAVETFR